MRSAQCAHLFTDAENEKDVHLHDTACNYLLLSQNLSGLWRTKRVVKKLLVILIVEIFWQESPLPVDHNYRSVVTTAYTR
jgi:hypothetical protein